MTKNDQNCYQTARESAGFTQEDAAEQLTLSVQTLSAYERGLRRPADLVVRQMVTLYGAPELAYQHLSTSELADVLFVSVQSRGLQEAAMRVVRLVKAFAKSGRLWTLLEIAEDGVIDDAETPVFREIMEELHEITESVVALSFVEMAAKKTSDALACNRSRGR